MFFDECIDRLTPDSAIENVRLIESDDWLKRYVHDHFDKLNEFRNLSYLNTSQKKHTSHYC